MLLQKSEPRPYDALRTIVEEDGGTMAFERTGHDAGGAWVVMLRGKETMFEYNGRGFPRLDQLYEPRVAAPDHWRDYYCTLRENARAQFLEMLQKPEEGPRFEVSPSAKPVHNCMQLPVLGPFAFLPGELPTVLDADDSNLRGVYIWSIRHPRGELVHYVGETGRSFRIRFEEHLISYLSGQYDLFEPTAFASGELRQIWKGTFRRGETLGRVPQFLDRREQLLAAAQSQLRALRLWIIPWDFETRDRQLVEAAIAVCLRNQPPPVGSFWEKGIHYKTRDAGEPSIPFRIERGGRFVGMPEVLAT